MSAKLIDYKSITNDLGAVLSSGATPNITLYVDSASTKLFADSDGVTFSEKVVASVNYTEPHNTEDNTQVVNGYLLITFNDGTIAKITDNVDTVYYVVVAVPFKPRTFN
jgi:hypothetical protein